jgi:hypothetical protein
MARILGEKKHGSMKNEPLKSALNGDLDLSLIELMDGLVNEQSILIDQQRDTITALQDTIKVLQEELDTQRKINNLRF